MKVNVSAGIALLAVLLLTALPAFSQSLRYNYEYVPSSTATTNARPRGAPTDVWPEPVAKGQGVAAPQSDSPETIAHDKNGLKFFKAAEYAKAIAEFEQVIAMSIDKERIAGVYMVLGASYNVTRQYAKTIASMTKAIALNKRPQYYDDLGKAYEATLQLPNAIEAFKEAVRLEPKDPINLIDLGTSYLLNNQKAEARHVYDSLLLIDKELAESLLFDIDDKQGRFGILIRRAQLGANAHDKGEILQWSHYALKLNPTDPDTLLEIGFLLQRAEQYDEALTIFRGVIAKKPKVETLAEAHFYLGRTFVAMGRKRDAMQAYSALKPLDEKLAQTLLNEINKP